MFPLSPPPPPEANMEGFYLKKREEKDLEKEKEVNHPEPEYVNVEGPQELNPPSYVAWCNRFLGSLNVYKFELCLYLLMRV
jgi:hypothetical protein